jgi:hypothetical protein
MLLRIAAVITYYLKMETAFEMLRVFNKYGLMLEKAVVNAIFVM